MDDTMGGIASSQTNPTQNQETKPPKRWSLLLLGSAPFLPEIVWEKLVEAMFVALIGGLVYGFWAWIKQG